MALDPYGFPVEDTPVRPGRWWGSALALASVCFLGAACCLGGDLFVMHQSPNEGIDWLGVALLISLPMWPLLGIGVATLTLYGGTGRGWTLLGPNVVVGGGAGVGLWLFLFLATIFADVLSGG